MAYEAMFATQTFKFSSIFPLESLTKLADVRILVMDLYWPIITPVQAENLVFSTAESPQNEASETTLKDVFKASFSVSSFHVSSGNSSSKLLHKYVPPELRNHRTIQIAMKAKYATKKWSAEAKATPHLQVSVAGDNLGIIDL
jgi:hypothetical protein